MKFRLAAQESVREGLIRVVHAEVAASVQRVRIPTDHRADDVHAVRVSIKRLRATWRLISPVCPSQIAERENNRLRDAALSLAGQRDGVVARKALESFRKRADTRAHRQAVEAVFDHLADRAIPMQSVPVTESAMIDAAAALESTASVLASTPLTHESWDALLLGLDKAWRGLRKSHQNAAQEDSSGNLSAPDNEFHEFRKRVKRMQFQLELVRPAWPKRLKRVQRLLIDLGDALGEDHDLIVLRQMLRKHSDLAAAVAFEMEVLDRMIALRSRKLRRKAFRLADELFSRRGDKMFIHRLGEHWRQWRGEPEPPALVTRSVAPVSAPPIALAIAAN